MRRTARRTVIVACAAVLVVASIASYFHFRRALGRDASSRPQSQEQAAQTPAIDRPILWLLAIGVSHYKSGPGLRFADADAQAIAQTFEHQKGSPLYRNIKTRLLVNENASRESIFSEIEHFLFQASLNDVAIIFMAGHGVRELADDGGYYFLPYDASAENLHAAGIAWSDFNREIKQLRQRVDRVVIMLDTCHAGALGFSRAGTSADEIAHLITVSKGTYLLAASAASEESIEKPEWGHGAFTYELLQALGGGAARPGSDIVSLADVYSFLSREVPQRTGGKQRFTADISGPDLILTTIEKPTQMAYEARAGDTQRRTAPDIDSTPVVPNSVQVINFRNERENDGNDWLSGTLGSELNTDLYNAGLEVYWDSQSQQSPADRETARRRGRGKVATGSYVVWERTIKIYASIIDTETGKTVESVTEEGGLPEALRIAGKVAVTLAQRLSGHASSTQLQSLVQQNDAQPKRLGQMLAGEGVIKQPPPTVGAADKTRGAATEPQSRLDSVSGDYWRVAQSGISVLADGALLGERAYAAEGEEETRAEALKAVEDYRLALEQKNLDRLATLFVSFSGEQRAALQEYFDGVENLRVRITNISVEPRGQNLAVSYTRRDIFIDRETGKEAHVEARLTKLFVRDGEKWKIGGGS